MKEASIWRKPWLELVTDWRMLDQGKDIDGFRVGDNIQEIQCKGRPVNPDSECMSTYYYWSSILFFTCLCMCATVPRTDAPLNCWLDLGLKQQKPWGLTGTRVTCRGPGRTSVRPKVYHVWIRFTASIIWVLTSVLKEPSVG